MSSPCPGHSQLVVRDGAPRPHFGEEPGSGKHQAHRQNEQKAAVKVWSSRVKKVQDASTEEIKVLNKINVHKCPWLIGTHTLLY